MIKFCSTLICFLLLIQFESQSQQLSKKQLRHQQEVWAETQKLAKAMVDADSIQLDQLTAKRLSYGHSGGKVEGKQEFIKKLVSGKSDFVNINMEEQQIDVFGKTAIVRFLLHAETLDNQTPGKVNLRVLLVWKKSKNNWILLARQAVKIP
jgi:hypothetical protein